MKNRGSQYLRGKKAMLKVMMEERGLAPKQIGSYIDQKCGVEVKVFEGCGDGRKFRTVPVGWSD